MTSTSDVQQVAAAASAQEEMTIVGWRVSIGRVPNPYLFKDRPVSLDNEFLQAVVLKDEAEQRIAAIKDECDERGIDIDVLRRNLEDVTRSRDGWESMAAQMNRDCEFYRGLIVRCGEAIGKEAYRCDDGSVSTSVLALKVPELVEAAFKPRNRFIRALSTILTGK